MTVFCSSCGSEQPDGMRFCGACGTRLPRRCTACGTPAPREDQRFCGDCGAPLAVERDGPRERRLVSVLFCDLAGFTAYSESRDAEDVRDALDHYFGATRRVVEGYGGTIEKFIGDAVMAVWGTPVAREDDAERAVRAGLEIAAAVAGLAVQLTVPGLAVRVGILTGEAAVNLSNVMQGMVIGDAVNTASRIQALAPPGSVYVDDVTRLATERSIGYEPGGSHEVKGKRESIRVWRAVRVVSLRGGGRRPGAVEPVLVGRDGELQRLKAALDVLLAEGGGARAVTVSGEAGLGKSRLAWELEKYADGLATGVRWLAGRSLDFGEGVGFSPLAEMFRTAIGIATADPAETERARIGHWITELWPQRSDERERARDAVERLLDLEPQSSLLDPGALFWAWRAALEREAARTPLVLCFEELQRAEDALLQFLAGVLEWSEAPILIVALGRPDARFDPLALHGERIELTALSDETIDALVRSVVVDPPEPLLRAIQADGGGVPLFAVETLRALADTGRLRIDEGRYVVNADIGEIAVPPTIRALIASRLDRLGPLERRTLAGGAVLGERFSVAGTAALAGLAPADAETLLRGLVAKAMLRPQVRGDGGFEFLQGVVRRVLLSSLARRDRRRLHLTAIDHLTSVAASPDLAAQLANHLLAAERADPDADDAPELRRRAGVTLRDAAERAAGVGSLEEAVALLDRAAELSEDERVRARVLERAGAIAQQSGAGAAAAERYRAAGALHEAAGRERDRLAARVHELRAERYQRDLADRLDELSELDAALAPGADAASALAGAVLAFTLYQCGRHEEAVAVAARAAQTATDVDAGAELAMALSAHASALSELERPEEALEIYERALARVQGSDERRAAALAGSVAIVLGSLGRFEEALALAGEAQLAARRSSDRVVLRWARVVASRCRCSLGDWDEAVLELEAVLDDLPTFQLSMASAPLVAIALGRGQTDRARAIVAAYDRRCGAEGASLFEPDFRVMRALVLALAAGDSVARLIPESEASDYAEWSGWLAPTVDHLVSGGDDEALVAALETLRGPGRMKRVPPVQAQAERLHAHLLLRAGDLPGANAAFGRAIAMARDCGLRFDAAVISVERARARTPPAEGVEPDLEDATAVFERLRAGPWVTRARAASSERARSRRSAPMDAAGGPDGLLAVD
jgi:class 3 adenylate cyclase/predicted ATPase